MKREKKKGKEMENGNEKQPRQTKHHNTNSTTKNKQLGN